MSPPLKLAAITFGVAATLLLSWIFLWDLPGEPRVFLSRLPSTDQNSLLRVLIQRKEATVRSSLFWERRLVLHRDLAWRDQFLENSFSAVAGTETLAAVAGTSRGDPVLFVRKGAHDWRAVASGSLSVLATRDFEHDRVVNLTADGQLIYLQTVLDGRYSFAETYSVAFDSWRDLDVPGLSEIKNLSTTASAAVGCGAGLEDGVLLFFWRDGREWRTLPAPDDVDPLMCGFVDNTPFVAGASAEDTFSPQTVAVVDPDGKWRTTSRAEGDYMFMTDTSAHNGDIWVLLHYSAGSFTVIERFDVTESSWHPVASPEFDHISTIVVLGESLVVGGGFTTELGDCTARAAVAFMRKDGSWETEVVSPLAGISRLATVNEELWAAGYNEAGPLLAVRQEPAAWTATLAAPVPWNDLLDGGDVSASFAFQPFALGWGVALVLVMPLMTMGFAPRRDIFVSYRRSDTESIAGRIYERLVGVVGRKHVFKDVDSLIGGKEFVPGITAWIARSDVVLVVIGQDWNPRRGDTRRMDSPEDFVRLEIETARSLGVPVLPVLVSGAGVPEPEELPSDIRWLAGVNALPVREDPDFRNDMRRVLRAIRQFERRRRD